jgi:1-acyl-sn-glycerol-3-phosphate acyltransferase
MNADAAAMKAKTSPARDAWRPLRYALRVPLLLWHIVVHLPLTLILITPVGAAIRLSSGERLDHRAIRWWQGGLMRVFGFRLKRVGTPRAEATLFVANHCSWLDITLIHSQRALCFVAKSEIARWPLVGWLASRGGTIYHRRGSNESLNSVAQTMVAHLRRGDAVGVFPEGGAAGTVDHVRTFHARIFQTCYDADVPAQPVALRYVRGALPATSVAFRGEEKFFHNFLRLLGEPGCTAEVHFLEPVALNPDGRRRMADAARRRIIEALNFGQTVGASAGGVAEPSSDELDPVAEADAGR